MLQQGHSGSDSGTRKLTPHKTQTPATAEQAENKKAAHPSSDHGKFFLGFAARFIAAVFVRHGEFRTVLD